LGSLAGRVRGGRLRDPRTGWPDDPDTVEDANAHPDVFAHTTVGQIADRVVPLPYEEFRYAFANAVDQDEAKELYETYAVPGSGAPILQAAAANLHPWTEVKVDRGTPTSPSGSSSASCRARESLVGLRVPALTRARSVHA
jgi:hypothetical protein